MKNTIIKFPVSLFSITVILLCYLSQACVPSKNVVTVQPDLNSSSSDPVSNPSDSSIPLDSSEPSDSSIPSDSSEPSDTPTTFTVIKQLDRGDTSILQTRGGNTISDLFKGRNSLKFGTYISTIDLRLSETENPDFELIDPIDPSNYTITTEDYQSVLTLKDTIDLNLYKAYKLSTTFFWVYIDFDCNNDTIISIEPLTSQTASPDVALNTIKYSCVGNNPPKIYIKGLDEIYTHARITYKHKSN